LSGPSDERGIKPFAFELCFYRLGTISLSRHTGYPNSNFPAILV
jgi:hypothetical protein